MISSLPGGSPAVLPVTVRRENRNKPFVPRTVISFSAKASHQPLEVKGAASKDWIGRLYQQWDQSLAEADRTMPARPLRPDVTVIIPVYNAAKFLPDTLDSLSKQTLKNWEALLVNDGSTDNSLAVAQSFAKADPRIRVINGPHTGIASIARNWMASRARGQFISQMDSDDMFENPDVLKRQVDHLRQSPDDVMIYASAIRVDAQGRQQPSPKHDAVLRTTPDGKVHIAPGSQSTWPNLLSGNLVTHTQASMIRKDKWTDVPLTRFYEDHLWYIKVASQYGVEAIKMMPFKGFAWRKNPDSLTQDSNRCIEDVKSIAIRNRIMFQETPNIPESLKDPAAVSQAACKRYLRMLNKVHFEHHSLKMEYQVLKAALKDACIRNKDIYTHIIQPHFLARKTKSYRPNFV